jgi:hypothetical protein
VIISKIIPELLNVSFSVFVTEHFFKLTSGNENLHKINN